MLRSRLVPRAGLIKATRAVGVLRAIAGSPALQHREQALDLVETARLDPVLHPLEEIRALQAVTVSSPDSPLAGQLARFVDHWDPAGLLGLPSGASPGDLVAAARRRSGEATGAAALAVSPTEVDASRVLARSYQLLARRLAATR